MEKSFADILKSMTPEDREEVFKGLPDKVRAVLQYDWSFWSRPEQRAPEGLWQVWSYIAGRGSGKTRSGAEWTIDKVDAGFRRIALVAPTHDDFDKVMVNGDSGILACSSPWNFPEYNEGKKTLTWPNGARAFGYSAEKPDRLRGPQHDAAWCDEIAAWHHKRLQKTWDMMMFGLRLGNNPQCLVTTTPILVPLIRELIEKALDPDNPTHVATRGSTYDNKTNLAGQFFDSVITAYEGTRLGRQELLGELLTDIPNALFLYEDIHGNRVEKAPENLRRVVVAVDPSGASDEDSEGSDEIGIVAVGMTDDNHYYVLNDKSLLGGPETWAQEAIKLYKNTNADMIVAEINYGGEMVISTIKQADKFVKTKKVTASRGKTVRAQPISLLYEQGRVHHVGTRDKFSKLEDQLCLFTPGNYLGDDSPDRADACIWALSELSGNTRTRLVIGKGRV